MSFFTHSFILIYFFDSFLFNFIEFLAFRKYCILIYTGFFNLVWFEANRIAEVNTFQPCSGKLSILQNNAI